MVWLLAYSLVALPSATAEDLQPKPLSEMSSSELVQEAKDISKGLKKANETQKAELSQSKEALDESIKAQASSEEKSAKLEEEAKRLRQESSELRADLKKAQDELTGLKTSSKSSDAVVDETISQEKKRADRNEKIAIGCGAGGIIALLIAIGEALALGARK